MNHILSIVALLFMFSPAWANKKAAQGKKAAPKARTATKASKAKKPIVTQKQASEDKVLTEAQRKAIFEAGNKLYNQNQYAEALSQYQRLLKGKNWENFSVLYNVGNCYFRLQHYGLALGYFKKAQRLQPNDLRTKHNVQLIYSQLKKAEQGKEDKRARLLFWYALLNLQQLFYVVAGVLLLTFLFWSMHIRRTTRNNHSLRWPVAFLLTASLVLTVSLGIKLYKERFETIGIVTKSKVTVRSGYGENFEPMFLLTEADEVKVVKKARVTVTTEKGDQLEQTWLYIQISLPEKGSKQSVIRKGWVLNNAIFTI